RVYDEARATSDVLPRNILDVTLECVLVGEAVPGPGVKIERQLSIRVECGRPRRDLLLGRPNVLLATTDEREAIERVFGDYRTWSREKWRPDLTPGDRPFRHRRAEKIARGDRAFERCTGDRRIARKRGIDSKVGTPVGRNQEAAPRNFPPRCLPVRILFVFFRPTRRTVLFERGLV